MAKVRVNIEIIDDSGKVEDTIVREGSAALVLVDLGDKYAHDAWLSPMGHAEVLVAVIQGFIKMCIEQELPLSVGVANVKVALEKAISKVKESEDDNDDDATTN